MNQSSETKTLDGQRPGLATPGEERTVEDRSGEGNGADGSSTRLSWPHLYLGALGFAISLYSLRVHNIIERGGDAGCGFTETITCDKVLSSDYAKLLGIPLGTYGMAFFIVVIIMGITTNPRTTEVQAALWRLLLMTAGIFGSLTLLYISFAIIRAACPVCMATHAVVITLFIVSLVQFLKARRIATMRAGTTEHG